MRPLVVWRFSDGKAGHDGQSRGLIAALARLRAVETLTLEPLSPLTALRVWLSGYHLPAWHGLPTPDIVLGAGHRTHLSLLAARRRRGGKADAGGANVMAKHLAQLVIGDLANIGGLAPE